MKKSPKIIKRIACCLLAVAIVLNLIWNSITCLNVDPACDYITSHALEESHRCINHPIHYCNYHISLELFLYYVLDWRRNHYWLYNYSLSDIIVLRPHIIYKMVSENNQRNHMLENKVPIKRGQTNSYSANDSDYYHLHLFHFFC